MKKIIYTEKDIKEARVSQRFNGRDEIVNLFDKMLTTAVVIYNESLNEKSNNGIIYKSIATAFGIELIEGEHNFDIFSRYCNGGKIDSYLVRSAFIYKLKKALEYLISKEEK